MSVLTKRRLLACLLAAVILALSFSACAASADVAPGTEVPTEGPQTEKTPGYTAVETTEITGEMTTKTVFVEHYAEYPLTILRETEETAAFAELGEVLSAAEAERDAAVCAVLGVTLTRELTADMAGELVRRNASGTSPDLLEYASAKTAAAQAASGLLADLDSLEPFSVTHYALDAHLVDALSISGRCYFLFGDATVGDVAATSAILLDRTAAEAAGYDLDLLLRTVDDGEWTVERMIGLITDHRLYLDGDAVLPLFVGSGGRLFVKDEQGVPALTPDDAFSRAYAAMQTVLAAAGAVDDAETEPVGAPVFTLGELGDVRHGISAMPIPAAQPGEPYRSAVDPARATCISVPASPADPHRTGNILTAYFEESSETVAAAVNAYLTADTDPDMLAHILNSRECLLGALFGWGDLADALVQSVGMREDEFLASAQMRMTAASRAMEIFLGRLQ